MQLKANTPRHVLGADEKGRALARLRAVQSGGTEFAIRQGETLMAVRHGDAG